MNYGMVNKFELWSYNHCNIIVIRNQHWIYKNQMGFLHYSYLVVYAWCKLLIIYLPWGSSWQSYLNGCILCLSIHRKSIRHVAEFIYWLKNEPRLYLKFFPSLIDSEVNEISCRISYDDILLFDYKQLTFIDRHQDACNFLIEQCTDINLKLLRIMLNA